MTRLHLCKINRRRGFTLIEVLLASFIFMSVVVIAIGSFTSQITLQENTKAQRDVQQTTQTIIESLSRDIRTYEDFSITGNPIACGGSNYQSCGDEIEFSSSATLPRKRYWLNNQDIRLCTADCTTFSTLNDPSAVEVATFIVEGVTPDVNDRRNQKVQPFAVISLSIRTVNSTGKPESEASLDIRTMVTSRLFNKYR